MGRFDFQPRPTSFSVIGNLTKKNHFWLAIGQNFDEEERKPLSDGIAPYQSISDVSVYTLSPINQDIKSENVSSVKV